MNPSLSIVIPCYNEAEAIEPMAKEISAFINDARTNSYFRSVEVIVVDDASTDGSFVLLQRHGEFRVISSPVNGGYGAALKKGFSAASGDLLTFLDMDGTYSIFELYGMREAMLEVDADVVFGARPMIHHSGMPLVRKVGNQIFSGLTKLVVQSPLSDVCTGQRLMRASTVGPLVLSISEDGLDYSMALTVAMVRSGLGCIEVPVSYRVRIGESKLTVLGDGFRFLWALTRGAYGKNHHRHLTRP